MKKFLLIMVVISLSLSSEVFAGKIFTEAPKGPLYKIYANVPIWNNEETLKNDIQFYKKFGHYALESRLNYENAWGLITTTSFPMFAKILKINKEGNIQVLAVYGPGGYGFTGWLIDWQSLRKTNLPDNAADDWIKDYQEYASDYRKELEKELTPMVNKMYQEYHKQKEQEDKKQNKVEKQFQEFKEQYNKW